MAQPLSFHSDPGIKAEYVNRVNAHAAAYTKYANKLIELLKDAK